VAPGSEIRPVAEYDAGAALIKLQDWTAAATVLEAFREVHPDHELHREATKQVAFVYREEGNLARAAEEYERVAKEAEVPEMRREALLVAGQLYEDAKLSDRALALYQGYVAEFPLPLEVAVETRFKIADMYDAAGDEARYHAELKRIVKIDRTAGAARTERIRYLGARSALVLTEGLYDRFAAVKLVQPFEKNLQKKRRRMDAALEGFGRLVDYEVGEVTAAATFYMAEVYFDFSQSLLESERPADLDAREMQDYELVLEEEAFPFEERSIEVHEKNLELMRVGVYNAWVEKSLGKLAVMMPGRYAKFEASSGLLASIDTYAYRRPSSELDSEVEEVASSEGTETEHTSLEETAMEASTENVESSAEIVEGQDVAPAALDPAADALPAAVPAQPAANDGATAQETINDEVDHVAID